MLNANREMAMAGMGLYVGGCQREQGEHDGRYRNSHGLPGHAHGAFYYIASQLVR
jgi:hypothetical protein